MPDEDYVLIDDADEDQEDQAENRPIFELDLKTEDNTADVVRFGVHPDGEPYVCLIDLNDPDNCGQTYFYGVHADRLPNMLRNVARLIENSRDCGSNGNTF